MNEDLKIEFKDFIRELSTCISKEILLEDMENVKEDHIKNIRQYKTILSEINNTSVNLKDINISMCENMKIIVTYKDILRNNTQNLNKAIIKIMDWNESVIEEIRCKKEVDLDNYTKAIKESIKNELDNMRKSNIEILVYELKLFEKNINTKFQNFNTIEKDIRSLKNEIADINKTVNENSKQFELINETLNQIKIFLDV